MKPFNLVFNSGLAIAALILISRDLAAIQMLLYIGTIHMVVLAVVGWKSSPKLTPVIVDGLHKAGFLHTLMALAAALVISAHYLGSDRLVTDLRQILLPMGAALIPHVLGVWSGQVLGSRYFEAIPALEESIFKKLAEDADAAREIIRGLFHDREQSLRQQIASLQFQTKLLEDIRHRNTKVLEDGISEFTKMSDSARQLSKELTASLQQIDGLIRKIASSGSEARTNVDSCRKDLQSCAAAFQETFKVLQDVRNLHDAISELLAQKLFQRGTQA